MSRRISQFSAILSVMGSRSVQIFVGIISLPLLVRFLGPTEYGRYAIVLSVFGLIEIVMNTGTNGAVSKFISEKSDPDWQAAIFGHLARVALALGTVIVVGLAIAVWAGLVDQFVGQGFRKLFYLLGGVAIGRQLRRYLRRTLMGLQLESRSEALWISERVIFPTLAVLTAYYGYGVAGILIADMITSIVVVSIGLALVGRELPIRSVYSKPKIKLPEGQIFNYIGQTVLFFLLLKSLYHVDVLILQYYYSDTVVGFYKAALQIAEILWFAPAAVQSTLIQRISQHWLENNIEIIQRKASTLSRYVLLITGLLTIGVAGLAGDFIPIYFGVKYAPAVDPLLLLLPGVLGFAIARPTIAINQGRRSLQRLILATVICSILNLVLNLTLIPRYGMIGAAVATSIGYGSLVVFQAIVARHLGYRPFAALRLPRILVTACVASIAIFGTAQIIDSSILSLLIVPPVGLATYVMAAVATGGVSFDELKMVAGILPDRIERLVIAGLNKIPNFG